MACLLSTAVTGSGVERCRYPRAKRNGYPGVMLISCSRSRIKISFPAILHVSVRRSQPCSSKTSIQFGFAPLNLFENNGLRSCFDYCTLKVCPSCEQALLVAKGLHSLPKGCQRTMMCKICKVSGNGSEDYDAIERFKEAYLNAMQRQT